MRRFVIVLGALLAAVPAMAQLVADGDFSTWTFSSFSAGGGTATMTREPANGNPGARLNVTTVTSIGQTAFGTGLKTDVQTTAALEGRAFTLSLDVLSAPGTFGQGQAIHLLVEQGGTIYTMSLAVTNVQTSFATLQFPGVLNAAGFARQIGAGPATPVFDGSVITRFGFAAGNSESNTLTQYYDNFSLSIAGLTPTPTVTATVTPPGPTLTPTATSSPTTTPVATATQTPTQTATPPGAPVPVVPTLGNSALLAFASILALVAVWFLRRG